MLAAACRVEPGQKRVRAYAGGELVVDTTAPLLVWENPHYPAYYLPRADVTAVLVPTTTSIHSPSRGDTVHYTVKAGGKELVDAAWQYPDSPLEEIRDHVRFDWNALDAWFEEDEEVYVHPRSPYARVDILPSSRHVRVLDRRGGGGRLAPAVAAVRDGSARSLLPPQGRRAHGAAGAARRPTTACPYKGTASYWTAVIDGQRHEDLVWSYPVPPAREPAHRRAHRLLQRPASTLEVDGKPVAR